VVGDLWELCALLREALSVLSKRFSSFLLTIAEVPQVARADVGPLEISLEHSNQVGSVVNLVGWEFLEPPASSVRDEKWELSDDSSIISSSASQLACQPEVCQPQL
jgi:hypothetical protein